MTRYRPYPQYKDSGIPWLGEIPAHWDVRRLKFVASVTYSNVDKHVKEGEIPVRQCNYVDVYKNEHVVNRLEFMEVTARPEEIRRFLLQPGDIILTKDSEDWKDIAVPAFVPKPLDNVICGYHLALIRPNSPDVDASYLFRSFQASAINYQFQVEASGITRYGLGKRALGDALVLLPPLPEQRAIAVFLDRETARINALIAKKRDLIDLLRRQRTAVVSHAVTQGLDPNVPLKDSGIAWLGQIPAHWDVRRLKFVTLFAYGDSLSAGNREEGDVPVFGSNGIVGKHNEANTLAPCIVIGRKGSFGKVNYSDVPVFAIDTTFFIDRRTTKENIKWLYYLLGLLGLDEFSQDSAVPGLSRGFAYNLYVPYPDQAEQRAIAAYLDRETARIDELIAQIEESIALLQRQRIALISAAVTGKIDVRDLNDNGDIVETLHATSLR